MNGASKQTPKLFDALKKTKLWKYVVYRSTLKKMYRLENWSDNNNVTLFFNGDETFQSMWESIENAKESINIETYTIEPDRVGLKTIELLTAAQRRGCKVKFVYDAIGSSSISDSMLDELRASGATLICFNPFFSKNFPINFRNHRKMMVVDDKVGYCGGMNISEKYAGELLGNSYFRDTHVKIEGPAVKDLLDAFYSKKKDKKSLFSYIPSTSNFSSSITPNEAETPLPNTKPNTTSASSTKDNSNSLDKTVIGSSITTNNSIDNSITAYEKSIYHYYLNNSYSFGINRINSNNNNSSSNSLGSACLAAGEEIVSDLSSSSSSSSPSPSPGRNDSSLPNNVKANSRAIMLVDESIKDRILYDRYSEYFNDFNNEEDEWEDDNEDDDEDDLEHDEDDDLERELALLNHNSEKKRVDKVSIQVLESNLMRGKRNLQRGLSILLKNSKSQCFITTPYFLPPRLLRKAIIDTAARGIEVKIITAGKSDVPWVRMAGQHIYRPFLQNGVRIFEMTKTTLHSKTITIDGKYNTIGSYNFDHWSQRNLEVCVSIADERVAKYIENQFHEDLKLSEEITIDYLNNRSLFNKIYSFLAYQFGRIVRPTAIK
ncbi:phospholipase D [Heterostelium album PN500]|uniref:Phospholipase D n=1 Tax=Heterostelium pallidum (strain ATCC 26659 / Pp 5 / PN500) TaxID=670386 RepID=D3BT09_HETP5|nr:phospholipase D [Heterostelium album PN500]EFA75624.1 phospholipase D [Heterostelium album PN500]|eukprot:XP_020427758.1 phospholipase D [Heterostelium album PN500]